MVRNVLLVVGAILLLVLLFNLVQPAVPLSGLPSVPYSDVVRDAAEGRVRSVVLQGRVLRGISSDGSRFEAYLPDDPALARRLAAAGVEVVARPEDADESPVLRLLVSWVPMLLFLGIWFSSLRHVVRELRAIRALLAAERTVSPAPGRGTP